MVVSNGAVWRKKCSLIKNQETSRLELHYIVANNCFTKSWNDLFKMNKIVNKFLLAGENFMSEMPLA